jgi:hypothetical protein
VGLDPQLLSESPDHARFSGSRQLFLDGARGIRGRQSALQLSRQSFEARLNAGDARRSSGTAPAENPNDVRGQEFDPGYVHNVLLRSRQGFLGRDLCQAISLQSKFIGTRGRPTTSRRFRLLGLSGEPSSQPPSATPSGVSIFSTQSGLIYMAFDKRADACDGSAIGGTFLSSAGLESLTPRPFFGFNSSRFVRRLCA